MATNRTMFTGLTEETWEAGLRWVRANKQSGLTLLVVNMGLDESQVSKLNELGVKVTPNTKKTGADQVDVFNSFLAYYDKTGGIGTFLFWDMEAKSENVGPLWGATLFAAPTLEDSSITSLVFPLSAIDDRVRIGARLESEVIQPKGGAYYSGLMAGSIKEWMLFVGLYNTLVETGVVETLVSARNLVLNLFALYFPDHVETKPVEYEISALQPENQE